MANPYYWEIKKPLVMLIGAYDLGLILLLPTGVFYANQTGREACRHSSAEGAYVPLQRFGGASLADQLHDLFRGGYYEFEIDGKTADAIDAVLAKTYEMEILTVDRARLGESHDGWVYVQVASQPDRHPTPDEMNQRKEPSYCLYGFGATRGVLTW